MSLITDLNSTGSFVVGSGGGASSAYPVLSIVRRSRRAAPEGLTGQSMRRVEYDIKSLAAAAAETDITALQATLQSQLERNGQQIAITERGAAETIGAEGSSGGPRRGFPRYDLSLDDAPLTAGVYQSFTLRVVAEIPINAVEDGSYDIHEDDREETTETDEFDRVKTTIKGTLRVQNGQNAKNYVVDEIIAPLRTAAASAGRLPSHTTVVKNDPALCEWTYTETYPEPGQGTAGGDPITDSAVDDVTERRSEGRKTRTIRGYALGTGATTFATNKKPTPGTNEILVASRVSAPSEPDGRVDFDYELLQGYTTAEFSGAIVFSFQQELGEETGGRAVRWATRSGAAPKLWLGDLEPHVYTQTDVLEFRGTWPTDLVAAFPLKFDANRQSGKTRVRLSGSSRGTNRIVVTRTFVYDTDQSMPSPRVVEATL